jgi:hypothetical protein
MWQGRVAPALPQQQKAPMQVSQAAAEEKPLNNGNKRAGETKRAGCHLLLLRVAASNMLRNILPAHRHAAPAVLFDLADGGAQFRSVILEALHLQLTHHRSLRNGQS